MNIESKGYYLMEWDLFENDNIDFYVKGKIKLRHDKRDGVYTLFIKGVGNEFHEVKEISNFWELYSLDNFLNSDMNSEEEDYEFQKEFYLHIKDINSNYEYIIINKENNNVYGVNDLISSDGFNNHHIEKMWLDDKIIIIDVSEDIEPMLLTEDGWENIHLNDICRDINDLREEQLERVTSL